MYKITVANDGNSVNWEKTYSDALPAFTEYLKFIDWGFADEYRTVNLFMPDGKCYTKTFYRDGRVITK